MKTSRVPQQETFWKHWPGGTDENREKPVSIVSLSLSLSPGRNINPDSFRVLNRTGLRRSVLRCEI
jgi:hypothetical protein